jgi:cytochrome bd-type quinol oxidase subunit 1
MFSVAYFLLLLVWLYLLNREIKCRPEDYGHHPDTGNENKERRMKIIEKL